MKPYARQCGGTPPKLDTNMHYGRINQGMKFVTPDGKSVADKTGYCSARPGAKQKIRNAKRSFKKRARQRLKRDMQCDGGAQ